MSLGLANVFTCSSEYLTSVMTCCSHYIICALKDKGKIAVWNMSSAQKEPGVLIGHHLCVSTVALSHWPDHYLCSCSSDNAILWNLSENGGCPNRGKVLFSNLSCPHFCCFSDDNSKVYISLDSEIIKIELSEYTCHSVAISVCPVTTLLTAWNEFLVMLDANHCCKVWNLTNHNIVHQRVVSSGYPVFASVDNQSRHIAVATSIGELFIYAQNFSTVRTWKIWRLLKKFMHSKQKSDGSCFEAPFDYEDSYDFPILNLHLFTFAKKDTELTKFFPKCLAVIVVTSCCLFVVDVNTEEVVYLLEFERISCTQNKTLGVIRSASISEEHVNDSIYISLLPVANNFISLVKLHLVDFSLKNALESLHIGDLPRNSSETLSFFYNDKSAVESSYLNFKMDKTIPKKDCKEKKNATASTLFKPTTFHSKIKSSGYGDLHKSSMFSSSKTISLKSVKSKNDSGFTISRVSVPYKNIFDHKPELLNEFDNSVAITSTKISGNGSYYLCASSTGTVNILKIKPDQINHFKTISCHQNVINSVNWSHSGKFYLTASVDKTAKLWCFDTLRPDPLLSFSSSVEQSGDSQSLNKKHYTFEDEVSQCQFYYVDEFILVSSRNVIYMYSYDIHSKSNDLKRFENNSCKHLVTTLALDCQRITAIAAINQFFSNLVLLTDTSNCLNVLDMNVGKVVHHVVNISTKPSYGIALNEGSPHIQQPNCMYDIFLTASSDGIKLWDLRSKQSIINYHEHQCQMLKCGVTFSPCGRYIAAGSGDNSVYIYDLRSTYSLCKLNDPLSAVTSIDFSPSGSQLLATTINGKIYSYS